MSDSLPAGWCAVPLADCVLPVASLDPATRPDDEFTYCDISAIDNDLGKVVAPKLLKGQDAPGRARQAVRAGDVLFSTVRPGLRAIARVPDAANPVASTGFCVLRAAEGIDGAYLYQLVRSDQFLQQVLPLQRGVSYPAVRDADVLTQAVPLPPRAEQTRIVLKLEELLSDLDAGVAELKAAQKKLQQYRQSLLKAAVEGSLTAAWRETHPAPEETGADLLARILRERRARWEAQQLAKFEAQGKAPPKGWQSGYTEPDRLDGERPPETPSSWAWTSLGQCFRVAVGATPSRKEAGYWGGSVPWVSSGEIRFNRISNTKEQITERGLQNSSTQINPKGSVLLGMIGEGKTRGQVAILDVAAANNQNCAAIWVTETDVPPEFVYAWLWSRYDETRRGSSGNNQPALNKSIVERIPFPLPPIAEAREIVRVVDGMLDGVLAQEALIATALQQSTAQRQNLLRAAFAGQLVPQDPADEPAAELLARIRAERAALGLTRKPRGKPARVPDRLHSAETIPVRAAE